MGFLSKRQKKSKNKRMRVATAVLIVVIIAAAAWVAYSKWFTDPKDVENTVTTSEQPSAQADYNAGGDDNKEAPGNTLHEGGGSAGIAEGAGSGAENTGEPIVSSTGEITVYAPAQNSVVKSGQVVSGASSLPTVSYRIIDNVSGVIASGQLNVVDGKFSGKLNFDTSATEGRLDIFATKADGTEYSNIAISLELRR